MGEFGAFIARHPALFTVLALIVGLIIWAETRRLTRGFKDISPAEAVRAMNHDGALMLDVRDDSELVKGFITGAKHLPLEVLEQRWEEIATEKEQPVIAYCGTGQRSAQACAMLRKHGFQQIFNLKGGLSAWKGEGLPVVKK